jgi:hypothetical protein
MRFLVMLFSLFLMNQSVQAQSNLNEVLSDGSGQRQNLENDVNTKGVSFCTKPSKPYCVNSIDKDDEYDSCISTVEFYIDNLASYQACVVQETTEDLYDLLKVYTCRLRGKDYCSTY